jgi:hypothetical protein
MDPHANLREQRELAERLGPDAEPMHLIDYQRETERLCELVMALDEWRQRGGFDPYDRTHAAPFSRMRLRDEAVAHLTAPYRLYPYIIDSASDQPRCPYCDEPGDTVTELAGGTADLLACSSILCRVNRGWRTAYIRART